MVADECKFYIIGPAGRKMVWEEVTDGMKEIISDEQRKILEKISWCRARVRKSGTLCHCSVT